MSLKTCTRCGEAKNLTMFNRKGAGKYSSACKHCISGAAAARYASDAGYRERVRARTRRNTPDLQQMSAEDATAIRSIRAERKRMGRIMARPGYRPARHDAHVVLWKKLIKADLAVGLAATRNTRAQLHDAHVKAAKNRIHWLRAKVKPQTRQMRLHRLATARQHLSDSYIPRLITDGLRSCPTGAGIPPALIDLKRMHLKLRRYLNQKDKEQQ